MQRRRFAEKFAAQARKVDRLLFRLLVVGFCLLIAVQSLLLQPQARKHLSYVHRAEGEEIMTGPVLTEPAMHICITLLDSGPNPAIKVLVNGKSAGNFRENPLYAPVNFGDNIAIDGTHAAEAIQFRLGSLPPSVDTGSLITSGTCRASIFYCGKIVRREESP